MRCCEIRFHVERYTFQFQMCTVYYSIESLERDWKVLTTHATEQAIVGGRHSDVSMMVAIETHPQAKGCL